MMKKIIEKINSEMLFWLFAFLMFLLPTYITAYKSIWNEENYSHGPIILAILIWLFFKNYNKYLSLTTRVVVDKINFFIFIILATLYVVGHSQSIILIEILSQLLMVLLLMYIYKGVAAIKLYGFFFVFSLFLLPIPGMLIYNITHILKENISFLAEYVLFSFGYPVARQGVTLTIGQYQLLVADACSGLNSIISLSALGLLYIYLTDIKNKLHIFILLSSIVPIAIFANLIRVITLIIITYYFGDEAGQGYLHNAAGFLLFFFSLMSLFMVDKISSFLLGNSKA